MRAISGWTHARPCRRGVLNPRDDNTMAWKMSCRDVTGVPCAWSTRIAYSMRLLDDSSVVTWSTAVSLSFTITPRTRRVVSRLMSRRGGGGGARLRPAEKIISFVLLRLSWRLLAVAHACRCSISAWHVSALTPGTTRGFRSLLTFRYFLLSDLISCNSLSWLCSLVFECVLDISWLDDWLILSAFWQQDRAVTCGLNWW